MTPGAAVRGRGPAGSAGALASTAARRGLLMASPDEPATGGVGAERASTGAVVPGRIATALPSGAGAVGWVSVATGGVAAGLSPSFIAPLAGAWEAERARRSWYV